ncbi:hypothetical protein [Oceanicoccus sagamiensis]|uniref:Uncharacterized protein n=1 Tax=Oceanicoccus sagamiensis TaxID=716816 RepID=A0A1X9NCJ2_9GAMM|nr:hypothetical protein [Oceanicoccus sagamiensis]ARN72687.1 hypothetical protein BST96_00295 [Oceanicoccus sagamiensis]
MYIVREQEKFIRIAYTGNISLDERRSAFRDAIAINNQYEGLNKPYIVDMRRCGLANDTPSKEGDFSRDMLKHSPGAPIAYLVPYLYGPNDFVVQLLSDYGIKARNFINEEYAHRWLGIGGLVPDVESGSGQATVRLFNQTA